MKRRVYSAEHSSEHNAEHSAQCRAQCTAQSTVQSAQCSQMEALGRPPLLAGSLIEVSAVALGDTSGGGSEMQLARSRLRKAIIA